jgi:hypothetical protein
VVAYPNSLKPAEEILKLLRPGLCKILQANFYEKALFVKAAVAATVSECNGLRPSRYASIRTFGEPTLRWLGA